MWRCTLFYLNSLRKKALKVMPIIPSSTWPHDSETTWQMYVWIKLNYIYILSFMLKLEPNMYTGLMIMASHQTFSSQIKHLSGQIKFSQTNLLYIINGEVFEFAKDNECLEIFSPYHKHCVYRYSMSTIVHS